MNALLNQKISNLCFGTLTLSPLQKNLSVTDGAKLLKKAYEMGINFFDTAELYQNYAYIKQAFTPNDNCVIATKTYAYSKEGAEKSLSDYLSQTGRERAEMFLLHEQESEHTLRGHFDALEYLFKKKEEGLICAVGISTHFVSAVLAALKYPQIDVIHPILNLRGIGIADGTRFDMERAIISAREKGKFIYSMKPLGGGHLIQNRQNALEYIKNLDFIDSVAIGIGDENELIFNYNFFNSLPISSEIANSTGSKNRSILIQNWCVSCGKCAKVCKSHALEIKNNKLTCDKQKCVLCGYCGAECENMAIKVI